MPESRRDRLLRMLDRSPLRRHGHWVNPDATEEDLVALLLFDKFDLRGEEPQNWIGQAAKERE